MTDFQRVDHVERLKLAHARWYLIRKRLAFHLEKANVAKKLGTCGDEAIVDLKQMIDKADHCIEAWDESVIELRDNGASPTIFSENISGVETAAAGYEQIISEIDANAAAGHAAAKDRFGI